MHDSEDDYLHTRSTISSTRRSHMLENITNIGDLHANADFHAHIVREKAFLTPRGGPVAQEGRPAADLHRHGNARSRRQTARERPLTPISGPSTPSTGGGRWCPTAPGRRRPRHHGGPSPMTTTPRRIQLRRTAGWRKPTDAIVVARTTRWGNPLRVGETVQITTAAGDVATVTATAELAVAFYRDVMQTRLTPVPGEHPDDAAWVTEWRTAVAALAGRDLACWCPLDQPCHADVLLELANGRQP